MERADERQAPGGQLAAEEDEPRKRRRAAAAPFLLPLGLLLLACAFSARALDFMDGQFGFERLVAGALGFLFLYVAWVAREQGRLRERLLDLMEEVLKVFYGPDFRRRRQAVDILVRAMESEDQKVRATSREHLVRLAGVDLGADAAAWSEWWAEHRSTFRSPESGEKSHVRS
ncbi:MAG: hypothetical protein HY812_01125 [Planctomycetes bacterium]|nr:hypothetical protein [Planctomycetota bacterium]